MRNTMKNVLFKFSKVKKDKFLKYYNNFKIFLHLNYIYRKDIFYILEFIFIIICSKIFKQKNVEGKSNIL
jgi:hypothetical protein